MPINNHSTSSHLWLRVLLVDTFHGEDNILNLEEVVVSSLDEREMTAISIAWMQTPSVAAESAPGKPEHHYEFGEGLKDEFP